MKRKRLLVLTSVLATVTMFGAYQATAGESIFTKITTAINNLSAKNTAQVASTPTPSAVSSSTSSGVNVPAIQVGPAPTGHYVVERQPAPGSCHYRYTIDKQPLPDQQCTPGATNPNVTQANIQSTICKSGYTALIRPSASITGKEKIANAKSYGYTGSMRTGEYDHLISLELGGASNSALNLWVEPQAVGYVGHSTHNPKDTVETKLKTAICGGRISLAEAQSAIATDWTKALSHIK